MFSISRNTMGVFCCVLTLTLMMGLFTLKGIAAITDAESVYLPLVLNSEPTPTPTITPSQTPSPTEPEWLTYVNQFRDLADVSYLTENSDWSAGDVLHSRYMVKEDEITHDENVNSPWYTLEGYDAGRNGNVAVSSSTSFSDESAIDLWMTGPFHAVGILDPQLAQTGFGSYRENIGTWKTGATLDVLRGIGDLPTGTNFPIYFPKDGGQTWLTSYGGNEWPDPLASCPDYYAPSGPPIILQLGSGGITPNVTASSFQQGNTNLDYCIFDETNYSNSDIDSQNLARNILNARDAIVIMPRYPLLVGQAYTVSVTTNGSTYIWSFSVVSGASINLLSHTWQTK